MIMRPANIRKGIIMAGGSGTRLYPITKSINKHLLPVYNKPMIYYPITTLMMADIREILVITTPEALTSYEHLLGDGHQWGLEIVYATQSEPNGIGEAFLIAKAFLGSNPCALILGDNIFYGSELRRLLQRVGSNSGATIFAYQVQNPQAYGVVEFDESGQPIRLQEKPEFPKSNHAVTGLYFYDNQVVDIASNMKPSARGELEITDINEHYLEHQQLVLEILGRGFAWLDAGSYDELLQANLFVSTIESRQGLQIACPEEIAFRLGYINQEQVYDIIAGISNIAYARYLTKVLEESESAVKHPGADHPLWLR